MISLCDGRSVRQCLLTEHGFRFQTPERRNFITLARHLDMNGQMKQCSYFTCRRCRQNDVIETSCLQSRKSDICKFWDRRPESVICVCVNGACQPWVLQNLQYLRQYVSMDKERNVSYYIQTWHDGRRMGAHARFDDFDLDARSQWVGKRKKSMSHALRGGNSKQAISTS